MILYVFLVDTGTLLHFDVDLALTSVENLKKAISYKVGIPAAKQVLLISGGESLQSSSRVCSYRAAGTETSPIFLFNKLSIERDIPPVPMVDYGVDVDVKEKINSCLFMEPNYNTVVARADLARELYEISYQQLNICEKIVEDQYLQHQGWGAVIANLEDIGKAFKNSADKLKQDFSSFITKKSTHLQLIENFDHDLHILSKIPLLSCLQEKLQLDKKSDSTLLDWINQKDAQFSLKQVADQCLNTIKLYDEGSWDVFEEKVHTVISSIDQKDMKEIKGLQSRLSALEELISRARKLVHELCDLSKAFSQNQQRASNLCDSSIFPDLCQSHEAQLKLASKNYQELRDIREKCVRAKREFCITIHKRLQWVMHVEKQLAEVDGAILIYRENIRRLSRYLEVINQIHLAPKLYFSSVSEVVRRKNFSNVFLDWANHLASQFSILYAKEIEHRKKFNSILENHFLMGLFNGMTDVPSAFSTEPPQPFDQDLPNISSKDVSFLQKLLPEYTSELDVPFEVPLQQFLNYQFPNTNQVNKVSSSKPNESDIEEFETLNDEINKDDSKNFKEKESTLEVDTQTNQALEPLNQSDYIMDDSLAPINSSSVNAKFNYVSTSCNQDEKIDVCSESKGIPISSLEVETLQKEKEFEEKEKEKYETQIKNLTSLLNQTRNYLFNTLEHFKLTNASIKNLLEETRDKNQANLRKINLAIKEELETQENVINSLKLNLEGKEKEHQININKWTQQLNDLKNKSESLSLELLKSKKDNQDLLSNFNEMIKVKENLEKKIEQLIQDKDNLIASHKSDIECLRGRFKIAMSKSAVECTPSESSLEKIEKESSEHMSSEQQISLLRCKLEECQAKYDVILSEKKQEKEIFMNQTLNSIRKKKDAIIDDLKRREANLTMKLLNFKEKIDEQRKLSMVNTSLLFSLFDNFWLSLDDKETLMEISTNASQIDMSVFNEPEKIEFTPSTSSVKDKDKVVDASIFNQSNKVSVLSCEIGDIVLLCYHEKHQSYLAFSLLPTPHFLHNDCIEVLNLKSGSESDNQNWALAEITDKEYCQAKKPQNRYRVPVNARFYRIKAKPWLKANTTFRRSLNSTGILTGYQMSSSSTLDSETPITSTGRSYILPEAPESEVKIKY